MNGQGFSNIGASSERGRRINGSNIFRRRNFIEADWARVEVWNFHCLLLVRDTSRMFIVEEGVNWVMFNDSCRKWVLKHSRSPGSPCPYLEIAARSEVKRFKATIASNVISVRRIICQTKLRSIESSAYEWIERSLEDPKDDDQYLVEKERNKIASNLFRNPCKRSEKVMSEVLRDLHIHCSFKSFSEAGNQSDRTLIWRIKGVSLLWGCWM